MLTNTTHLKNFAIRATDGELGTVDEFYFDDETWGIRYLVVDTGGWLGGQKGADLTSLRNPYRLASQTTGCVPNEKAG